MRIGAHVSTVGGILRAFDKAQEIGAECLQIFSSAPQQWKSSTTTKEVRLLFQKKARETDILPVFIHGTYLINLASNSTDIIEKSKKALIEDLQFCHDIGSTGVIFHFGSRECGWKSCANSVVPVIHEILEDTPEDTFFIIENAAGSGFKIGGTLEELSEMKRDISSDRVTFCLDTAHALAYGYEFRTEETAKQFSEKVEQTIGWSSVSAIHLNDSKIDLGKKNDRHENIGEGFIGSDGFYSLFTQIHQLNIPLVLETPGFDENGPDKENIDRVKTLRRLLEE